MQNRASFLAVIRDGQILLVRSKTQQQFEESWSLPGGVLEPGEDPRSGAEREVLEETNIVAEAQNLFKVLGEDTGLRVEMYEGIYISGDLSIDETEIHDAGWFDLKELSRLELAYNLQEDLGHLL